MAHSRHSHGLTRTGYVLKHFRDYRCVPNTSRCSRGQISRRCPPSESKNTIDCILGLLLLYFTFVALLVLYAGRWTPPTIISRMIIGVTSSEFSFRERVCNWANRGNISVAIAGLCDCYMITTTQIYLSLGYM